jgi:hypothetical protein
MTDEVAATVRARARHDAYLNMVFPLTENTEVDFVGPKQIAELIWPFGEILRGWAAGAAGKASPTEVDAAIAIIAAEDSFEPLATARTEVWAGLFDRFVESQARLALLEAQATRFSIPVPRHASNYVRGMACLIYLLTAAV